MKAAIIGAGAIGGFYGAALADAGMDVSFIARGKTLIAIREHGLRLVGNTELTLDVPVTDDAAEIGQVDVVLLCTKTFQVAEAARTYLPALMGPHTLVVTTQNGVIAPHELSAIIGPEHVAPGVCRQWVKIVEPGLIMDLGGPRMFEVSTIDDSPIPSSMSCERLAGRAVSPLPTWRTSPPLCGSRCVPSSPKEPVVQYSTSPWATSLVPTAMSSLGVSTKLFRWLALTAPGSPTTSSRRTSHSLLGRIPRQQPPSSATSLLDAPANTLLR